jgi:hypothetical protein
MLVLPPPQPARHTAASAASAIPAKRLKRARTCPESASNKILPLLAAQRRSREILREWTPNP